MNLPLLKDNLSRFSNACGVIPGLLEELLKLILGVFDYMWGDGCGLGENLR